MNNITQDCSACNEYQRNRVAAHCPKHLDDHDWEVIEEVRSEMIVDDGQETEDQEFFEDVERYENAWLGSYADRGE